MGKKKKNNKNEQRQISQPPTDTSETTMPEHSDAINGIELLAEIGNSVSCFYILTFLICSLVPTDIYNELCITFSTTSLGFDWMGGDARTAYSEDEL